MRIREAFTWDDSDPLRRGGKETIRANQALRDYAEMGIIRSLAKLIRLYRVHQEEYKEYLDNPGIWPLSKLIPKAVPSRNRSVITEWSTKYHWRERTGRWEELRREAKLKNPQARRDYLAWLWER